MPCPCSVCSPGIRRLALLFVITGNPSQYPTPIVEAHMKGPSKENWSWRSGECCTLTFLLLHAWPWCCRPESTSINANCILFWLNIVLLAWQARLHSSPHVAGSKDAPLTGNESNHVGTPDEMNYEINFCYKNYSDVIPFRNLHGIRHN